MVSSSATSGPLPRAKARSVFAASGPANIALGGGTLEEAQACFASLLRYSNDVGLYGEEIAPGTFAAQGNFPQAYTHVGLINAALSLRGRAERGKQEMQRQHLRVPEAHP